MTPAAVAASTASPSRSPCRSAARERSGPSSSTRRAAGAKLEFFPYEARQIEHAAPQPVTRDGGAALLELAASLREEVHAVRRESSIVTAAAEALRPPELVTIAEASTRCAAAPMIVLTTWRTG